MYLVQLIYVSQLTEDCGRKELEQILETSRKNNAKMGITGILCYDPNFFLQCLEGSRKAVNELYATIAQDSRHKNVVILEYREIKKRDFGKWSMAYFTANDVDVEMIMKYNIKPVFDPYIMMSESARSFLIEIARERQAFLDQMIEQKK